MLSRDDYPAIYNHSRRPDSEGRECENALKEIDTLRRHKELLRTELAKHGWGDFHYTNSTEQDPEIVRLLEETK